MSDVKTTCDSCNTQPWTNDDDFLCDSCREHKLAIVDALNKLISEARSGDRLAIEILNKVGWKGANE